ASASACPSPPRRSTRPPRAEPAPPLPGAPTPPARLPRAVPRAPRRCQAPSVVHSGNAPGMVGGASPRPGSAQPLEGRAVAGRALPAGGLPARLLAEGVAQHLARGVLRQNLDERHLARIGVGG